MGLINPTLSEKGGSVNLIKFIWGKHYIFSELLTSKNKWFQVPELGKPISLKILSAKQPNKPAKPEYKL